MHSNTLSNRYHLPIEVSQKSSAHCYDIVTMRESLWKLEIKLLLDLPVVIIELQPAACSFLLTCKQRSPLLVSKRRRLSCAVDFAQLNHKRTTTATTNIVCICAWLGDDRKVIGKRAVCELLM